ncbi:MAG: hypothetical protein EU542_07395 [Promethearchaeota archaeon]|nr:MAG: hypothetical protein EU542_07395 [Candidatus Lokiarchaeota archaeon]
MRIDELTDYDILNGTTNLIFIIISFIIGILIIIKCFKTGTRELFTIGLTWIFISSPWWGNTFTFMGILLFNMEPNLLLFIILNNIFIPVAMITWIYSFSKMVYPNLVKKLMGIYSTICILYEIFLIYLLFIDPSLIATQVGTLYIKVTGYVLVYYIFAIVTWIITGILFTLKALESDDKRIRWKGKFLLIAFIVFSIGAFLGTILVLDPITLVIVKIILILSGFFYYLGFFLPKKLENFINK